MSEGASSLAGAKCNYLLLLASLLLHRLCQHSRFLQSDQEPYCVEQAAMTIVSAALHLHHLSLYSFTNYACRRDTTNCNVRCLQMRATSTGQPGTYLLGILIPEILCNSGLPPVFYIQRSQRSGQMPPKIPHNHGTQHQLEVIQCFIVCIIEPHGPLGYYAQTL